MVRGVKLGLITGSLNPLPELAGRDPIDVIIEQCKSLGVVDVELVTVFPQGQPQVVSGGRFGQPPVPGERTPEFEKSRQALREWRIALPLDRFREVRQKFDAAKLNLFSYVQTIDDDMTDAEIDAVFKQMQALQRADVHHQPDARGHGSPRCAVRGEVQHQGGLAPACPGAGRRTRWRRRGAWNSCSGCRSAFVINLDIGHFTAGNNDAVAFLRKHHERITHLHIKDRRRSDGPNVQLGTGDTPIKECAALVRDNKWPIMFILEREYRDAPGTAVEQTRWQLDYVKGLLEA